MFLLIILCMCCTLMSLVSFSQAAAPEDASLVFVKGEGGYYCHKIPYLYKTTSNVLIALAEGRGKDGREACDDFSGTDLVYKRSFDGGVTWSPLIVLYTNTSVDDANIIGNAAPVQDTTTGTLWMPFCRNNEEVFMTHSDDDGLTWTSPEAMPLLVLDSWKWIGLGPPGGLQLSSGRLLIPSYHTTLWKGDGCASRGHTIISDDHGATWSIGSADFGAPFLSNECQAVELKNGSVLINARTVSTHRIQVISNDGGLTFDEPQQVRGLYEPIEGCEGSVVRYLEGGSVSDALFYSGPNTNGLFRRNMTIMTSRDDGASWAAAKGGLVDAGAVSYSSLQVLPSLALAGRHDLGLLYERSNTLSLGFEPDEICFWRLPLGD
jgi:sialidase-1